MLVLLALAAPHVQALIQRPTWSAAVEKVVAVAVAVAIALTAVVLLFYYVYTGDTISA